MFGVRLEGPMRVFCDNSRAFNNMIIPESILHKKHNVINYHTVCEAVAADILRVRKEYGETNLEDLAKKVMTGQKRWVFFHIFC